MVHALSQSDVSAFRLRVFVSVVEHRGYSAAAAQLELTQPSVSFHIKALERACGAKLLSYHNRRVELTTEGEVVYAAARAILRELEGAEATVQKLRSGQAGRLSIGASINFEQAYFFDRVIGPFRDSHPDVCLSVRFGHSGRLAEMAARRELDVAYVLDLQLPPDVNYAPLHLADIVYLASPSHPLAGRQAVEPDEVSAAGLITAPQESAEWLGYSALLARSGIRQPRLVMEVDGVQARVLAARAGMGIFGAFLPPYAAAADLLPLVVLPLTSPRATAGFGLVMAREREPSELTRQFVRSLQRVVASST